MKEKLNEKWKFIPGYNRRYQVSNLGRIKSMGMFRLNGRYKTEFEDKIMKLDNSRAYLKISLSKNSKNKGFLVHRLVGLTFISNLKNYPCINHKDGNKLNNKVDNLEWCSYRFNRIHADLSGLSSIGEKHYKSKLTEENVRSIRKLYSIKYSALKLSKIYKVSISTIYFILQRRSWKHIK